jgi:invasion protein IalB
MNLQTGRSINSPEAWRSVLVAFMALGISMAGTVANSQQVIPFGDVPATADFSEAEIAARGQQKFPNLTYSTWKKLCFRGAQGADTKMVCRTSIEGKSDLGQIILKVDLIEREDAPSTRLQIFVPAGNLLQPGIRLTVDKGTSILVPYTICLANGLPKFSSRSWKEIGNGPRTQAAENSFANSSRRAALAQAKLKGCG